MTPSSDLPQMRHLRGPSGQSVLGALVGAEVDEDLLLHLAPLPVGADELEVRPPAPAHRSPDVDAASFVVAYCSDYSIAPSSWGRVTQETDSLQRGNGGSRSSVAYAPNRGDCNFCELRAEGVLRSSPGTFFLVTFVVTFGRWSSCR